MWCISDRFSPRSPKKRRIDQPTQASQIFRQINCDQELSHHTSCPFNHHFSLKWSHFIPSNRILPTLRQLNGAMIYLPPLRRLLLPAIILLTIIVFYRSKFLVPATLDSFVIHPPSAPPEGIRVPISELSEPLPATNSSNNHLSPPNKFFYSHANTIDSKALNRTWSSSLYQPILDPDLKNLFMCRSQPNRYTSHLRLPNIIQNISQVPPDSTKAENRVFWNPTIISLPYWSSNQYLLVSRILTSGNHQENVLCEANICSTRGGSQARLGEKDCSDDDLRKLGPAGGMRCATKPMILSVPPTPAENCEGNFASYVDIPGFHDPRIFWSGKGEPLMMVNTQ